MAAECWSSGRTTAAAWNRPISMVLQIERYRGFVSTISESPPRPSIRSYSVLQPQAKRFFHNSSPLQQPSLRLPNSLPTTPGKSPSQLPRNVPSRGPVSGLQASNAKQNSPKVLIPETPQEEKDRRAEIERVYGVFVKKLRTIETVYRPFLNSPVLTKNEIHQRLVEARLAGKKAARDERIGLALQKYNESTIQPMMRILDQFESLQTELRLLKADFAETDRIRMAKEEEQDRLMEEHLALARIRLVQHAIDTEEDIKTVKGLHGMQQKQKDLVRRLSLATVQTMECLDLTTLRAIKIELVHAGRWTIPEGSSIESFTESIDNARFNSKFLHGAATTEIEKALAGLHFASAQLYTFNETIPMLAHSWRHINYNSHLSSRFPGLYDQRVRFQNFYVLAQALGSECQDVLKTLNFLLDCEFCLTGHRNYVAARAFDLAYVMHLRAKNMQVLLETTFCFGLSPLMMEISNSPFKEAQFVKLRPVVECLLENKDVAFQIGKVRNRLSRSLTTGDTINNVALRKSLRLLDDCQMNITQDSRSLWSAFTLWEMWTGVNDLYTGVHQDKNLELPVRYPGALVHQKHQLEIDSGQYQSEVLPVKHFRTDLISQSKLYPKDKPLVIHYIHDPATLHFVSKRLLGHSVIGVDGIVGCSSWLGTSQDASYLQYLVLATYEDVLLINLAAMRDRDIANSTYVCEILQDDFVLKVGANLHQLSRLLLQSYDIEMNGFSELGNQSPYPSAQDSLETDNQLRTSRNNDPNIWASAQPSQIEIREADMKRPIRYFHALACRALAQLEIYHDRLGRTSTLMEGASEPPSFQSAHGTNGYETNQDEQPLELGPVHIERNWLSYIFQSREGRSHSSLRMSRAAYLLNMTNRMAIDVMEEHNNFGLKRLSIAQRGVKQRQYIQDLQAYFLLTTFDEDLTSIEQWLDQRKLASRIIKMAQQAKLPLYERHQTLLLPQGSSSLVDTARSTAAIPHPARNEGKDLLQDAEKEVQRLFSRYEKLTTQIKRRDQLTGRSTLLTWVVFVRKGIEKDKVEHLMALNPSQFASDIFSSASFLRANGVELGPKTEKFLTPFMDSLADKDSWQYTNCVLKPNGTLCISDDSKTPAQLPSDEFALGRGDAKATSSISSTSRNQTPPTPPQAQGSDPRQASRGDSRTKRQRSERARRVVRAGSDPTSYRI